MVDISIVLFGNSHMMLFTLTGTLNLHHLIFLMCLLCIQQFSNFQNYYFNPIVDGVV
jgi:hypothetical protein